MTDDKSVNDAELHAYLDEQMDRAQLSEMQTELEKDQQAREKLNEYRHINRVLHNVYDPILNEKLPGRLLSAASGKSRYRAIAASVIFFLFGSLFGWQLQLNLADTGSSPSPTDLHLLQPAVFAHSVYTSEVVHPVEVNAEQHQHLDKWLSKRLKTTLHAPDLTRSGYRLIGGRLLPSTEDRMAAQYMYENVGGSRITLYVRRGKWGRDSHSINYSQQKGYDTFFWTDSDMGYVLTSDPGQHQDRELAKEIYQQLSINSVKI